MESRCIILSSDPALRSAALGWPRPEGVELRFYDEAGAALSAARQSSLRLFVLDLRAGVSSEGVLRRLRSLPSSPELMLLLSQPQPDLAGLPPDAVQVVGPSLEGLAEPFSRLLALAEVRATSGLVGASPAMRGLLSTIAQVAPLDVPVLIQGESGTGKEMVARALHRGSSRAARNFESLNVGSIAESLLESELFGHEKGAFTGAVARRKGVFERADGGTLFLDELGEMPLAMQVRLLRVLESSEYIRVGGGETLHTDVRLLAATHRSLEQEMAAGRFRSDLYYRLKVVKIEIAPLRERREDIPALVQHFLEENNRRHELSLKGLTRDAMECFLRYAWPGNVRELRNVLASMAVLSRGDHLGLEDLPPELRQQRPGEAPLPVAVASSQAAGGGDPLLANTLLGLMAELRKVHDRLDGIERVLGGRPESRSLSAFEGDDSEAEYVPLSPEMAGDLAGAERAMIESALRQQGGNRRKTAKQLGISERTLYRKLREYGL